MPWFPHSKYFWDFWFARKDAELHLFYLQACRVECHYDPEQRHDRASVGHAVLTPHGWRELSVSQPALEKSNEPGAWDNLSIWTGSVIQNPANQLYYLFYTSRCWDDPLEWTPHQRQRPQQIGLAVSPDLHQWTRSHPKPLILNPGAGSGFDGVAWRDPQIVKGDDGKFYAFICARRMQDNGGAGGVVVYVTSDDLEHWDTEPKVLVESDDFYQLEVPQVFWRRTETHKRLYLLFCAGSGDSSRVRYERMAPEECLSGSYYMFSDPVPLDTKEFPPLLEPARILSSGLYCGKLLDPETDPNPLYFGFHWEDDAGHFIGGLSDPKRVQFLPDGRIEFVSEGV
ncbi:hypothetical protein IQ268_18550 [Oculatella sp. LEGE 06141]|uniref:hypothetical protein n=1 Tax=Oculatella sp. LEGE 06141 TaxID=1828648 RepID=UPI00188064A4|nr:hypothetical protein [Oculatella sp. LEGE 06141]MBE9180565.1 hypothetical protein [Oculatella sp. LEGE 06141]